MPYIGVEYISVWGFFCSTAFLLLSAENENLMYSWNISLKMYFF